MSCIENEIIYEDCLERFWELLDDYDFKSIVDEHFLSPQQQWQEKEFGRMDEDAYSNAFDIVWKWDCEAVSRDIKECIREYIVLERLGKIENG